MDDESPSLKIKLYLFSSVDTDQQQGQRELPVGEKKYGRSTGLPIYISGLSLGKNTYVFSIKPDKSSERLGKAKHFLEPQYYC